MKRNCVLCFGWTVLDILGTGSDGTANTAGYQLSFEEIEIFIMKRFRGATQTFIPFRS